MALPILVASEFAFSAKLSLKSGVTWAYESLWCRLLKLAYWNGLNNQELEHIFGPQIYQSNALLSRPEGLILRKFTHYFKEPEHFLTNAFPPFNANLKSLLANSLRGCQRCYQMGFHSVLFQITFLKRCPLHGDPIVEGCPHCNYQEPYAITDGLHRNGYRCSECKRIIIRLENSISNSYLLLLPKLTHWRRWISLQSKINNWNGVVYPKPNLFWLEAFQEWNEFYGEIPQIQSTILSPTQIWNYLNLPSKNTNENESFYNIALHRYIQLKRLYYRLLGTQEQWNYQKLVSSQQGWWPTSRADNIQGFAFLFWRYSWERSLISYYTPTFLSRRQLPVTIMYWFALLPLDCTDNYNSIISHQFNLELVRSYRRSVALAHWMQKRGGVLLTPVVLRTLVSQLCVHLPTRKKGGDASI